MKISEDIIHSYQWSRAAEANISTEAPLCHVVVLADALQQAVAENLKMKFEATNHCITAERKGDGVTAYRTNFDDNDPRHEYSKADWLAEADKLLRGQQYRTEIEESVKPNKDRAANTAKTLWLKTKTKLTGNWHIDLNDQVIIVTAFAAELAKAYAQGEAMTDDRATKKAEELLPSGLCPYSQLHGHGRGAKVDRRICEICWTANKVAVAAELRALYDKLLKGEK